MSDSKNLSRRNFLKASGVVAMGVLAVACAPMPAPGAQQGAGDSAGAEAVTLDWWSEVFTEHAENRIEAYAEVAPNVTINYVSMGWGEMTPKLMTAIAGGTPPDIVTNDRFRMVQWVTRGGVMDLTDFVEAYGINEEDYPAAAWEEGSWQGKPYSIPNCVDSRMVMWNRDLFEEAGLDPDVAPPTHDWEAMQELAVTLTTSTDGEIETIGFIPAGGVGGTASGNGAEWVLAFANAAEFLKDDQTAWMDNPDLVETLTWQKSCLDALGGTDVVSEFATGLPNEQGFDPFGAGTVAINIKGSFDFFRLFNNYPELNYSTDMWKMHNSPDDPISFIGGFCLAIPEGVPAVTESQEFLNFLLSDESFFNLGETSGLYPAKISVATDPKLAATSPTPEFFLKGAEAMTYGRIRPVSPVGETITSYWAGTTATGSCMAKRVPNRPLRTRRTSFRRNWTISGRTGNGCREDGSSVSIGPSSALMKV